MEYKQTDVKKNTKNREESKTRGVFLRLFGKWDLRDEEQINKLFKWLIFICFIVVVGFLVSDYLYNFPTRGSWLIFAFLAGTSVVLLTAEGLKLFVFHGKGRVVFFIIEAVSACSFMFISGSTYAVIVYVLVLTQFYLVVERMRSAVGLLLTGSALYLGGHLLQSLAINPQSVDLYALFTGAFGGLFALFVHFVVAQIAVAFYRQYVRLHKALKELDESKNELEKAYAVVAEVSALEERQRIAKEIHDTAGHSITTVIMQTESAKRIIENDPEEAKNKIVSANLQAKHALEELRDSVHLLSGTVEKKTLKQALQSIINETTDGTGITFRYEIEDITLSQAKFRFICNTLKEGISNGLRHGKATAFWFECKRQDDEIFFLLSDNGVGADMDTLAFGFGLTTMQERARAFGGRIAISTEAEEGLELTLRLPIDRNNA